MSNVQVLLSPLRLETDADHSYEATAWPSRSGRKLLTSSLLLLTSRHLTSDLFLTPPQLLGRGRDDDRIRREEPFTRGPDAPRAVARALRPGGLSAAAAAPPSEGTDAPTSKRRARKLATEPLVGRGPVKTPEPRPPLYSGAGGRGPKKLATLRAAFGQMRRRRMRQDERKEAKGRQEKRQRAGRKPVVLTNV